jgi:hypothetical protein
LGIVRRRGKELGRTAKRFLQLLNERAQVAPQPKGKSRVDASKPGPARGGRPEDDVPIEAAADASGA